MPECSALYPSFNSLFEIRHDSSRCIADCTAPLSILFLRFRKQEMPWMGEPGASFNSLFEIPKGDKQMSAYYARLPFNSLFEIRLARGIKYDPSRILVLSILFLRFREGNLLALDGPGQLPFQFSFWDSTKMNKNISWRLEITFNSLFEIHDRPLLQQRPK